MTEWEYTSYPDDGSSLCDSAEDLNDVLEEYGKRGWQLVTIYGDVAYFKRPKNVGSSRIRKVER